MTARAFVGATNVNPPSRLEDGAVNHKKNAQSKHSEKFQVLFHAGSSLPPRFELLTRTVKLDPDLVITKRTRLYSTFPAEFTSTTFESTAVSDLSGRWEQKPMPA